MSRYGSKVHFKSPSEEYHACKTQLSIYVAKEMTTVPEKVTCLKCMKHVLDMPDVSENAKTRIRNYLGAWDGFKQGAFGEAD